MDALRITATVGFWVACCGLAYAYLGYPLVMGCASRWLGRRRHPPVAQPGDLPRVSLLIAAHNEGAVLETRIENALALDYPPEKLEIVVASDGSTDATAAIAQCYAGRGVRLLDFAPRRGKAAVLNEAFPKLKGDLVLLSDANVQTDPAAPRKLVRWFQDPHVGVVCGRLVLTDPHTGRNVDSLYWKYETFLKRCEGRLGALLGANGAIYAMRRELYRPIPDDTQVDDLVIPLWARLRTGCDLVFDDEALAGESTPPDIAAEFHRRARIGTGGYQSIRLLWPLFDPRRGWIALSFFSHKVLRWVGPFFLLGGLASSVLLCERPFYRWCLFGQLGFYLVSGLAALLPPRLGLLKPLRLATMFTGMNAALLLGFWHWLARSPQGAWRPTTRWVEADGTPS